jgi:branched-chain amino acid transport system permease protein
MDINSLLVALVKIVAIVAYFYGLMWVLGRQAKWIKIVGIIVGFGIVELAFTQIGTFKLLNDFDQGLLFQAAAMTMVALGLNLIYGFNGQFSLGQYGFYGIGAYVSADITYRWTNGSVNGLFVVGLGVILVGAVFLGISRFLRKYQGIPVMSSFALYLVGIIIAGAAAAYIGNIFNPMFAPLLGTNLEPGPLAQGVWLQVVFFLSVICGGIFAAEISFLFGLPVLSLGSDYFGIATLGFTIVVNTLMNNSDTILKFTEMKGGRGMIGIPKLTTWFWTFLFLLAIIAIMRNLIQSSTGRTILAVREDETAAKAMGVDVAGTKLMAFVVGSMFAGIGGGIYAHFAGFLAPSTFDFLPGFNPLIIVVFGGLGSMSGTIAASFSWYFFLEGFLRVTLSKLGTDAPSWRYVLYPIALLLIMLLRPQGLLGSIEWGFLKTKKILPRLRREAAAAATPAPVAENSGD